jgi:hypothetical protein
MATRRKRITKKRVVKKARRKRTVPTKANTVAIDLLQKINKKVTRIDHTVNAEKWKKHKAKKAARASELERAWAEREESGFE